MAYNVIKNINRLKPDRTYEYFYIGTDSNLVDCNDNSLLIPIKNPTLDKILPLKVNQETIDDEATEINSLDNIDKQGLYYISKTNIADLPDNIKSPFNLLVLTNGNSFKQILFKEERIYIRDNFSSAWSAALAKPFEGSNSSKDGTKGLVPAPKTTETGNYFLNANGNWTSLNNIIFTSINGTTPTFDSGFTSKGEITIKKIKDSSNTVTTATINNDGIGAFNKVNIKKNGKDTVAIDNECNGSFNEIKINSTAVLDTSKNTGAATITGGAYIGGAVKIGNEADTEAGKTDKGALLVSGGAYIEKYIRVGEEGGVYGAVWNDLADSITVNNEAEIEAGYCYCLKDNKYIKSSKYLDNGIIGIHSDTYSFKMGEKAGEKQLDCAVAGFVLAYVDKNYLPGTALTCTKDGRLTKMKSKDKQRFPEKIVATYWKDEPNEEWGSDNRKVKVNGRKWVKIK